MFIIMCGFGATVLEFQIGCADMAVHFAAWMERKGWRVGIEEVPHANPPRRTNEETILVNTFMRLYDEDPEGAGSAP